MKVTALLTCASPSPSSILSRDCKIMLVFSCSRLPLSLEVWLWSVPCRLSRSVRFSPRRASSPAITCWVLHKMSSPDNMSDTEIIHMHLVCKLTTTLGNFSHSREECIITFTHFLGYYIEYLFWWYKRLFKVVNWHSLTCSSWQKFFFFEHACN